ncbi:UDP-GlcNAc:betaGal beta-1,3-N-acetylglucosaminyltransferase-like 1 [Willisornis vidua]|uniref:UDP-GlcNAc:betaGal beta-1,3-N-acetylglucosaminyltransferase-like 1 n=1 Tax=Willisornis vidua TaxID=1566151 RepID=A0ABQ9CQ93_9PASS|nr:UDP-GlcNAc:betaGal beta-1,3-N-acetylglucosaminyltransferase-like 1 [Willisornis vidua]
MVSPGVTALQRVTLALQGLQKLLGVPEDLLFFYEHLQRGGEVFRVDQCLLLYRYHPQAATHSVLQGTIWTHRVRFLEDRVLSSWPSFTIWNAGKQGRRLYRSLSPANRKKVIYLELVACLESDVQVTEQSRRKCEWIGKCEETFPAVKQVSFKDRKALVVKLRFAEYWRILQVIAFCDVDEKKIAKGFYTYEESEESPKPRVPVCHFRDAAPPLVLCMKLDLTGGVFETNLDMLNLKEGTDYYHFN